jgi:signal recognition particle subunit SRP54
MVLRAVAGLQGAGKTTAAAKLGLYCQSRAEKEDKFEKILLVAADVYRPAAIDQLQTLGAKLGVEVRLA